MHGWRDIATKLRFKWKSGISRSMKAYIQILENVGDANVIFFFIISIKCFTLIRGARFNLYFKVLIFVNHVTIICIF